MRCFCMVLPILLILCGCAVVEEESIPIEATGRWQAQENDAYYFELKDDGTCVMFTADDEWVSAGTYTVRDDAIVFEMDTGSFSWIATDEQNVLLYKAGNVIYHYKKI